MSAGPVLANRRPCSNFPPLPFSFFLPLFSISVPIPSLAPSPPQSGPFKTIYRSGLGGATPKFFGGQIPPSTSTLLPSPLPFLSFSPISPRLSLRLELDPSNTARGLEEHCIAPLAGSGAEPHAAQRKANLVHFSFKVWHQF